MFGCCLARFFHYRRHITQGFYSIFFLRVAQNTFLSLPDIPKSCLSELSHTVTVRSLTEQQLAYFLNLIHLILYSNENKAESFKYCFVWHLLFACTILSLSSVFCRLPLLSVL